MSRGPIDRVARAERDAAFRRAVDEAKQRYNISDIVARTRKVTRAGRNEKRALCAFHNERTPSMQLNDAKGTYHCFGCGASGDLVSYVMKTEGLSFVEAMRWLGAASLPGVDPAQRAKAAAEDEADRQRAIDRARDVWDRAGRRLAHRRRCICAAAASSCRFRTPFGSRRPLPGTTTTAASADPTSRRCSARWSTGTTS